MIGSQVEKSSEAKCHTSHLPRRSRRVRKRAGHGVTPTALTKGLTRARPRPTRRGDLRPGPSAALEPHPPPRTASARLDHGEKEAITGFCSRIGRFSFFDAPKGVKASTLAASVARSDVQLRSVPQRPPGKVNGPIAQKVEQRKPDRCALLKVFRRALRLELHRLANIYVIISTWHRLD